MNRLLTARLRHFARNTVGASMVEFSIIAFVMLLLTGGILDFGVAMFQWNAATKALQQGVRLASVSVPVASGLTTMTGIGGSVVAGDPFPAFKISCTSAICTCTGLCTGVGSTPTSTAFQTIVYGRGETACGTVASGQLAGMCDIFWSIKPENVRVIYEQTGMGFAGRPGGPVPTITIELTGLTFQLPFLNSLLRLPTTTFPIPAMSTSATGEDLSTAAPS